MPEKVVILGGGVAGMSAAQELIERGYEVEILERQLIAGGKARSIPVMQGMDDRGSKERHTKALEDWLNLDGPSTPPGAARPWLPGEHGFRFFPNFYRHVTDTMSRIPFYDRGTVLDNLTDTSRVLVALYDKAGIVLPERFPRNLKELTTALQTFLYAISPRDQIAFEDIEHFAGCIWRIMTSCKERRFDEYERIGWWEFIGAEHRSEAYQKFLAIGITRSLVAAKARTASTKTIGDIFLQLLFGIIAPDTASNRLLNGPTNLAWIQPWLDYLEARGLVYHFETTVTGLKCEGGRVAGVQAEKDGQSRVVTGDWYIGALPIERMAPLITDAMVDCDPGLALLKPLANNVQWMNGIQFYLTRDVELTDGHVIFIDTPWALTAVSQRQFWPDIDLGEWGDGKTRGLLSIDISQWDKPGMNGKTARNCTRQEIADEVWAQLKRSLNVDGNEILQDKDLHYWFLDPDIVDDPKDPQRMSNVEPLLVNRVNTWRLRPNAGTNIPNFFLASDYVRTNTDLATMEGANEAARRAVNSILDRSGSDAEPCQVWDLHEPDFLEPLRAHDRARYHAGLPWDSRFSTAVQAALKLGQDAAETQYGGEGVLAPLALFAAEMSKPDSLLDNPVAGNALRLIGPPKGTISELAAVIPGLGVELPGARQASLIAEDVATRMEGSGGAASDLAGATTQAEIAAGATGDEPAPSGQKPTAARRLHVRQIG